MRCRPVASLLPPRPPEQDGQVVRVMGVTVLHAAAEHHHRVVEQRAIALLDGLHPLQHIGVLLNEPGVDLLVGLQLLRFVFVVRQFVVRAVLPAGQEGEVLCRSPRCRT